MTDYATIAVSVFGVVSAICGWVWTSAKSAERAEDNRTKIKKEELDRKGEIMRIDALIKDEVHQLEKMIDRNEADSKGRADINRSIIVATKEEMQKMILGFQVSRESHDRENATRLDAIIDSITRLSSQQGELKGTLNTFIDEMRRKPN